MTIKQRGQIARKGHAQFQIRNTVKQHEQYANELITRSVFFGILLFEEVAVKRENMALHA